MINSELILFVLVVAQTLVTSILFIRISNLKNENIELKVKNEALCKLLSPKPEVKVYTIKLDDEKKDGENNG